MAQTSHDFEEILRIPPTARADGGRDGGYATGILQGRGLASWLRRSRDTAAQGSYRRWSVGPPGKGRACGTLWGGGTAVTARQFPWVGAAQPPHRAEAGRHLLSIGWCADHSSIAVTTAAQPGRPDSGRLQYTRKRERRRTRTTRHRIYRVKARQNRPAKR